MSSKPKPDEEARTLYPRFLTSDLDRKVAVSCPGTDIWLLVSGRCKVIIGVKKNK